MNKTYRSIYNESLGTWVAVPETVKAKGKKSGSVISSTASTAQRIVSMSVIGSALMLAGLMLASTSAMAQNCTFTVDTGNNQIKLTGGDAGTCATALTNAVAGSGSSSGLHFYSVKGLSTDGNYNNDGAAASQALAAGVNASATGEAATAVGANTLANASGSVAVGNKAQAITRSIAIGDQARAGNQASFSNWAGLYNPDTQTAFASEQELRDYYAKPVNQRDTNQVYRSVTGHNFNIALGDNAHADGGRNVSIGLEAGQGTLDNWNVANVNIGEYAGKNAKRDYSVVIGSNAGSLTPVLQLEQNKLFNGVISTIDGGPGISTGPAIYIGQDAGRNNIAFANIAIGKNAGVGATEPDPYHAGNLFVGQDAGFQSSSQVTGTFKGTDGLNYVIRADGSNANPGSPIIAGANTAIGPQAFRYGQGSGNVAVGRYAMQAAKGGANTVVGENAALAMEGDANTALGTSAGWRTKSSRAVSVGNFARAEGTSSISIGNNSVSGIVGSPTAKLNDVAVGAYSKADGGASVALGKRTSAGAESAVAIGSNAEASGVGAIALGGATNVTTTLTPNTPQGGGLGDNTDVVPEATRQAKASGAHSMAIGTAATASADNAVAMGKSAQSLGTSAIAIGHDAIATGSVAMGASSRAGNGGSAYGDGAVATYLGGATVSGTVAGTAIGQNASADISGGTALGTSSRTTVANGVALGSNALAGANIGDVALGSGSATAKAEGTSEATIDNFKFGTFAGVDPKSTVSVGSASAERTITNVAAGRITPDSTDAINGSQLFVVAKTLGEAISNTNSQVGDIYFHTNTGSNPGGNATTNLGKMTVAAGAIGTGSVTAGMNAVAHGTNSVSIGQGAQGIQTAVIAPTSTTDNTEKDVSSLPNSTIAIGHGAQASGGSSIAIGTGAKTLQGWNFDPQAQSVANNYGIAIGTSATAIGNNMVIGNNANLDSTTTISAGSGTNPKNINNITLGNGAGTNVTGNENVILGHLAARGMNSYGGNIVIGDKVATGSTMASSIAIGNSAGSNSEGSGNVAVGGGAGANLKKASSSSSTIACNYWNYYCQGKTGDGSNNTALGANAGQLSGAVNISVGFDAARGLVGMNNTSIGSGVARNAQGIANVWIGTQSAEGSIGNTNTGVGNYSGSWVKGNNNTAIGNGSGGSVTGDYNTGLGTASGQNVSGNYNLAGGYNAGNNAKGNQNVALGRGAGIYVTGDNNVALGARSGQGTAASPLSVYRSVSAGFLSKAVSNDSIAIGSESIAGEVGTTQINAIAIGKGAQALAKNSISIGTGNIVRGVNSGAIGDPSIINGANSYSIGNNNTIGSMTSNAFAIGNNIYLGATAAGVDTADVSGAIALGDTSQVTVQNGVALGSTSVADRAQSLPGYVPIGVDPAVVAATTKGNLGAVSVGTADATRQIINVAAGTHDTDAVNVAQLKAVNAIATGALTFAGDSGASVTRKLGDTLNVVGGVTDATKLSDGNIGVVADGANKLTVKLAKDLTDLNSVTTGNTTINNNGLTIADGPSVTNIGINAGGQQITNVASGGDIHNTNNHNNAANIGDLLQAISTINVSGNFGLSDEAGNKFMQPLGSAAQIIGDGSITTTVVGNALQVALSNNINIGTPGAPGTPGKDGSIGVHGADGVSGVAINGKDGTIGLTGPSGASANIGVKDGAPGLDGAAGSTTTRIVYTKPDGTEEQVATINDGLKFEGNQGPTIAKKLNQTLSVKGGLANTAEASSKNIRVDSEGGELVVKLAKDLTDLNSVTTGNTSINNSGLHITGGPSVTQTGIDAGGKRITNVAAGVNPTDAVNVGQLGAAINSSLGVVNNRINTVAKDAFAGAASAMASAGLPQAYLPGKSMVAIAGSTFKSQTAVALGASTISDNGKWIIKGTVNSNSRGDVGATIGTGYQW